jgi:hypothetical protein
MHYFNDLILPDIRKKMNCRAASPGFHTNLYEESGAGHRGFLIPQKQDKK